MQNIFIDVLPPWVETGLQPAFYDLESGTVLQQTARMYARVNELTTAFNQFSEDTTDFVNNFVDETNTEIKRFENATDAEIKRFENATDAEIEHFEGVVNNTVEEYIQKFNDLHDYVEDYFDNLDVQEEINKKLDDMVEAGTLQEIITTYIQSNVAWTFDSVAEMQSATNLIADSYAQTYGFYSVGDGGSAKYKIRSAEENETPDGMFTIGVANNLIAELVINGEVNVCQLGAYGDGTHDDIAKLTAGVTYCLAHDKILTSPSGKTYLISTTLSTDNCNIDFNGSTIKTSNAIDLITVQNTFSPDNDYSSFTIKNIKLDLNSVATSGINLAAAYECTITGIEMVNVTTKGIRFALGYGLNVSHCIIKGNENSTSSIGMEILSSDSEFSDIVMVDCNIAIKNSGYNNNFIGLHPWILHSSVLPNSTFCYCDTGCIANITDCEVDTYQYVIYQKSGVSPQLNCKGLNVLYANQIYNHDTYNQNSYIIYANEVESCKYITIENSYLKGLEGTIKTYMCNQTAFTGKLFDNTLFTIQNNIANGLTNIHTGLTTLYNKVTLKGDIVEYNCLFSYDASATSGNIRVGDIPTAFRPVDAINDTVVITGSQWNVTEMTLANTYILEGVAVNLPASLTSGTKYIHLNFTYSRK